MTDHPGWYPPGQISTPPELPTYLKNVCDLKPILGVPSDAEVIGVHDVILAASRASGIRGMHDTDLFMKLADHLFNAQMARYRSRYSLVTFPSDATYTPPTMPAHVTGTLEPVLGAPSDDDIVKVQDALQTYQEFRRIPSMFDAHTNMELSQHLFNLQMARYMRLAGETPSSHAPQPAARVASPAQKEERTQHGAVGEASTTNNAGTGANVEMHHIPQLASGIDVRDLLERSNQLAERFNQLLGRSNELIERCNQQADQPSSQPFTEQFNRMLEWLTQLVDKAHQPTERSDRLAERFNQLFERFNQLVEQSNQPSQRANELSERSNELADRANQIAEKLNQLSEHSNQLAKSANKPIERLGDLLKNINMVLVGIQHAIVRNRKDNTVHAIDCLVNEKGETPVEMRMDLRSTLRKLSADANQPGNLVSVIVDGTARSCYIPDEWLGDFLQLYGIARGLCLSGTSVNLKPGKEEEARTRLHDYFSSRIG
ncbi:unnamed protein product [Rhizoctonia solani]|uniref:Laminin domain protein n=1 Tax=Rhizoctonia solani TaxID=456999 RepID=A0A8H3AFD6_9AGAM|nr:unnamed protein product [Rhizoctonia solani]